MKNAISIEGLSKRYLLNHNSGKHQTLRETITNTIRNPFQRNSDRNLPKEEFWALRDVSFNVKPGERVGIIGRNGAGKSTLLKVLSRITAPTSGRIHINGRISSLLEVGTGFHPELTGRENIFLNGAILGMSRTEIKNKFDEIVAFAEVEKFLDTPVKHYSSGMYVRLAFSVAAHLEPEILIVDEVLAVGDAQFQKKCIGKMESVGKEGRTVLFVSHNIGMIKTLCNTAVLLDGGQVAMTGDVEKVTNQYFEFQKALKPSTNIFTSDCGRFKLNAPYWVNNSGHAVDSYNFGDDIILRFEFDFLEPVPKINPGLSVNSPYGERLLTLHYLDSTKSADNKKALYGKHTFDCNFAVKNLAPGFYACNFGIRNEFEQNAIYSPNYQFNLEILQKDGSRNGAGGYFWVNPEWTVT